MANILRNVLIKYSEKNGDLRKKFEYDVVVYMDYDPQGISVKIKRESHNIFDDLMEFPIQRTTECCRAGSQTYVINLDYETLFMKFKDEMDARKFHHHVMRVKNGKGSSVFSDRTEDSSAMQYFQFYGYLAQQQNMLQDYVRTSTYQKAILANLPDFKDKIVLDVGAGSGILSFFAIQAGAKKVYAVEASTMAQHAETLVHNNNLTGKIIVVAGKIEEINIPEKVDVIISEPMGYMLYNERMLETYLHAKKWLDPKGRMYPSRGDLHIAPFSDENLYMEQYNKANFWYQQYFHGVDLSSLRNEAMKEYFRQPVVDTFDMRVCLAKSVQHSVNFLEADESDLHKIEVPLKFEVIESGTVHGLAFWFDVAFIGSVQTVWLSTSPTEPLTHWYQVRCLLERPLLAKVGQLLTGRLLLIANQRQSYDVTIELGIQGTMNRSSNTLDLKNPYFRYTGQTVQSPPGVNYTSPSENYWEQMDAQQQVAVAAAAVANRSGGALTMVNGLASAGGNQTATPVNNAAVNGYSEMQIESVHTTPNTNQNLIGLGNQQPNIHPGSITSTGRQRVFTATSTQQAQLIGGGISPTLFTSTINRDNTVSHNQQTPSVVFGNSMPFYSVNNSLMIGDYVAPGTMLPAQNYRP